MSMLDRVWVVVIGIACCVTLFFLIKDEIDERNAAEQAAIQAEESYIAKIHRDIASKFCSEESWKKLQELSAVSKQALDSADEQSITGIEQGDPMMAMINGMHSNKFNFVWSTANTEQVKIALSCTLLRAQGVI